MSARQRVATQHCCTPDIPLRAYRRGERLTLHAFVEVSGAVDDVPG